MKDNIVIFPGWYPTEEGVWFGCKLYKDWRLLREAIPEGGCWRRFIKCFSIAGRSMAGKAAPHDRPPPVSHATSSLQ